MGWHGYYVSYCYLTLYIFAGDQLLCARLRPSNVDGAAEALDEVKRIVARLRAQWPKVRIVVRGDSGFCREELMAWCEAEENRVDFLFGLARNKRLQKIIGQQMHQAKLLHAKTGKAARLFTEFDYQTRESAAGVMPGCSTSTSNPIWIRFLTNCFYVRCESIPTVLGCCSILSGG